MQFNDLLTKHGIEPSGVLVFRHRPFEPELRKVLPWLAAERPEVFNAYQQAQWPTVEKAMAKARYVASFIGHEAGKALFVGLYENRNSRPISRDQFWQIPENAELKAFGLTGMTEDRASTLWFDLIPSDFYPNWKGKLIVRWSGLERSWWRWAERNEFLIEAVSVDNLLVRAMPVWDEIALSREELHALPSSWKSALKQWRGIYLIADSSDGKTYVGSAYGSDNILGRWLSYASSGHGGNVQLRGRDPHNFRFSILQRLSPDLEPDEAVRIENTWKTRLYTREIGLNKN